MLFIRSYDVRRFLADYSAPGPDSLNLIRDSLCLFLMVNLLLKLTYEERLLKHALPEYSAHLETSYLLTPFVF
ncbi:MAG: hypothetical protein QGM50_11970 [Anaerolineae bacterium]|nr:hypothetical protein [Anaerolineae bacterium]MDK1080097.1 hypothetical protein [Anaerolineae bacterium]MDK1119488.1 hypothetical protein [Anaerolineae bacterium]